jgi:hypothetical protein
VHQRLFPNSLEFSHNDFHIEIVPEKCREYPELLNEIRNRVVQVATRSRGWDDPETLEHMNANFKLGPLYEANTLVLIRSRRELVGLVGLVDDWQTSDGAILHLCSLGFLPNAQGRGFLPVLLSTVWPFVLHRHSVHQNVLEGRVFLTAITQSPYLYAMLHGISALYPAPNTVIPPAIRRVARAVVHRFDDHLELEENSLILRNECQFFYKKIPYSANRSLNAFCDSQLRYDQGDVFVLVGRVVPERVTRYMHRVEQLYGPLFADLHAILRGRGYLGIEQPDTQIRGFSHA